VNRSRRLRKGKASGPEHLHDAGPRTDKSVGKQKRRREAKPHIHEDQLAPVRGSERLADPSPTAAAATAILKIIRRELIAWLDREPADLAGARAAIEQRLRAEIEAANDHTQ
jgi:hypothetical protein